MGFSGGRGGDDVGDFVNFAFGAYFGSKDL